MLHPNNFNIIVEDRNVNEITYKGSIGLPIHSWVRLTPSFSPNLVTRFLKEFKCNSNSIVLDPFTGIGTTILQSQFEGFTSVGVEINPFLHYVSNMKVSLWQKDLTIFRRGVREFISRLIKKRAKAETSLDDFSKTIEIGLPSLHNYNRWWREDVLKDLLLSKKLLDDECFDKDTRDFLKIGIISILMDVANVTYEGLQFTFKDRAKENFDVIPFLESRLNKLLYDIEYFQTHVTRVCKTTLILGDSTKLTEFLKDIRPTCVITSPPYPNRYSYVWNTRPYLYFFDFFTSPKEASDLDKISIGGTWGSATSHISKGKIEPVSTDIAEIIEETVEKIRHKKELSNTNLMANYVTKYFNMLYLHTKSLKKILEDGAKCAYVIGNSEIKGVEIPSDLWLAEIFEKSGFTMDHIIRVRRRNSGKGLYEAIVICTNV